MNTLQILAIGLPVAATMADVVAVIVVLAGARDRRVAHSLAAMAACMVLWNGLLGIQAAPGLVATSETTHLFLALGLGLMVLPASALQNACVWSAVDARRTRQLSLFGYAMALLLCLAHWRGLVIGGFVVRSWGIVGLPGPLYPLFVAYVCVCIGLGILLCARTLRSPVSPAVRLRVKYWILGAGVATPLGFTNFFANYGVGILPLGSLGNILMIGIAAYAAVRHRVMEIDLFIMRAAATLLAGVAVVLPLAGAVIWAYHLPFGASGSLVGGCVLLAAIVSLLVFSGFRTYLEQEVESSFFPTRRAARDAIRRLSAELVTLPHRADLGDRFAAALVEGLGVDGVAFYLEPAKPGVFDLTCAQGAINAPPSFNSQSLGTRDDDARLPSAARERYGFHPAGNGDPKWEACIPVRANGTDMGMIALAPKRSGAAIDDTDVTLLTMVATQLAIALKNADYVREIECQKAQIQKLQRRLEAENISLRSEVRSMSQFREIIGSSAALQRVLALVEKVAPTDASIVISGETGTGKELVARAIHDLSARRNGPLINVNCPAIAPGLAESELFGHERGAFTDAIESRPGKFELANGGTIFLDEVADLPSDLQVKLLRVLQEHETQRVGSHKVRKLNLRVVAATNRNLLEEMRANRFREDLYYRLAAVVVHIPPLRERVEDIPMLASFFLERAAAAYQKPVKGFTADALSALSAYSWPGNIRELENVVERAVLLCASDTIKQEHLSDLAAAASSKDLPFGRSIREEKLRRVEQALMQSGGNQAAAARLLGMSRSNFGRLLKSLGLKSPPFVQ